jgi:heme exporter protein A
MQGLQQSCRLKATALACRRGDRVLFAGLPLALAAGEACQITGANGVGKSSLIRILAGLARPYAGLVERSGTIGLIDDHLALDPQLPLGRALDFWAQIDGHDCAAAALNMGLAELLDVPVRYLSTGQRKRAAFARLIGQHCAIWLLDEPLNGLDTAAAALVMALTAEHCTAGGICIIASHQPFALPGMAALALAEFAP